MKPPWKLFAATFVIYLIFDGLASALRSTRGESGLLVGAVVVAAILASERLLFHEPLQRAALRLGMTRPARIGMIAAVVVALALLGVLAIFSVARGVRLSLYPGWPWLLPGLFAQAGVAEETLFRGFLFGRLREGRKFLHAATLSLLPFVAAHLVLFARMPWPVALAAVALAAVLSYPLACLFELGGRTIWAPAIVHFVAQSALKVTEASGESAPSLPLIWMAACGILPYGVFLFRRPA